MYQFIIWFFIGTNYCKALKNGRFNYTNCIGHVMLLVVNKAMYGECNYKGLITKVRALVRYYNRSNNKT